ncbi:hypothetical protein LguiB_004221 [Lonicera macranthoides]
MPRIRLYIYIPTHHLVASFALISSSLNLPSMATAAQKPHSPSLPPSSSSSMKTFLISSVKFWFSLSLAASTLSLSLLSSTTTFLPVIVSAALHSLIFLSHKPLRALNAWLEHTPILIAVIYTPLTITAEHLSRIPDKHSVSGLLFSIFFTIDVLSVIQIIRQELISYAALYMISEVAVDRAADLYGFWGSCFMYGFTAGVVWLNYWLEQAIKEDSNLKTVQVTEDKDDKLPPTILQADLGHMLLL